MKIAIIGSGNIGGRLAKVWGKKNHRIFLGSRNPGEQKVKNLASVSPDNITVHSQKDAAEQADVILLAVPASVAFETVKELGIIKGKIIIDAMNAIFRKPEPYKKTSEAIIAASGNNHIVKCFNSVGAENMDNPFYGKEKADMFLCGDYDQDKKIVKQLAEECGFNVYDIGGLDKEDLTESAAGLWGSLVRNTGLGRNIAFKILRR